MTASYLPSAPATSPARWLLLFCALFGLRLSVALLIDATIAIEKNVDVYATVAGNIVAGHGFVSVPGEPLLWRAPVYPYVLAALFQVFGDKSLAAVLLAQSAFVACTGLLVFWLGRSLFGAGIGYLAAVLFALYPLSAYYTLRMLPEPLFTLALTCTIAAFIRTLREGGIRRSIQVGVLGGAAALIKPIALPLVPLLAFLMMARDRARMTTALPLAAVMIVGTVVVIAPWTMRNWIVTGHFVPVATGAGFSIWVGNNLVTGGIEEVEGGELAELEERMRAIAASALGVSPSEVPWQPSTVPGHTVNISYEVDLAFRREALREFLAHPTETLSIMVRKVFRLWFSIGRLQNQWAQPLVTTAQGALLIFAGLGIGCAIRRKRVIWPFFAPLVYLTLVHALTFSTLRYSMSMMPIVMVFVAAGLVDLGLRAAGLLGIAVPDRIRALAANPTSRKTPS